MSHAEDAATTLREDETLTALVAAENIYTYEETGRQGIGQTSTPNAFTDTKPYRLKPSMVIRQRSGVPDGDINDAEEQHQSYRAVVEVWLYSDAGAAL